MLSKGRLESALGDVGPLLWPCWVIFWAIPRPGHFPPTPKLRQTTPSKQRRTQQTANKQATKTINIKQANKQPQTANKQQTTTNKQPQTANKHKTTNNQQTTSNKQHIIWIPGLAHPRNRSSSSPLACLLCLPVCLFAYCLFD